MDILGGSNAVVAAAVAVTISLPILARLYRKGPYLSLRARLFGPVRAEYVLESKVDCAITPRLRAAVRSFHRQFDEEGLQAEAQLCVHFRGRKMLEAWGHGALPPGAVYDAQTVQPVLSVSELVTTLVVATLVDRGVVAYADPVVKHWAEFAGDGQDAQRSSTTIADLLMHKSPLTCLVQGRDRLPAEWAGAQYQQQLERWIVTHCKPEPPPLGQTQYHASTSGPILQAVVMRADPSHRTIQQIFKEDICTAVGGDAGLAFHMGEGLPPEGAKSVAQLKLPPALWGLFHPTLRTCWTTLTRPFSRDAKAIRRQKQATGSAKSLYNRSWMPFYGQQARQQAWYNDPAVHCCEMPNSNALSNARTLSALGALLASKGKWGERQVISEATWKQLMAAGGTSWDALLEQQMRYSNGGVSDIAEADTGGVEGFYGWKGWGGSLVVFNPTRGISIALTETGVRHPWVQEKRWGSVVHSVCHALDDPLYGGDNFFCV